VHHEVLSAFGDWAIEQGWAVRGITNSPIRGAEGNREFFCHLALTGPSIDRGPAIEVALATPSAPEAP
jgi:hypothetical protein